MSSYAQALVIQDNQKHQSIILQDNPSYDHLHSNAAIPHQNSSQNSELQEVTVANGNSTGSHDAACQPSGDQQHVTQSTNTYSMIRSKREALASSTYSGYVEYQLPSPIYHRANPNPSVSYLTITHA